MDQEIMGMSNILDLTEKLEEKLIKEYKKHLDLADVWLEQGDRLAFDDHIKMAESYLERIQELNATNS